MKRKIVQISFLICLLQMLILAALVQAWESHIIYYDQTGKLKYTVDKNGNRIPDFSHAGYKSGGVDIPDVPVVKTISPIAGDNTLHIQNALYELGFLPKDENGIRGALLLSAGEYEVSGTIKFQIDGVVLRGVGDGDDPATNTILRAIGNSPVKRTVLLVGGGSSTKWRDSVSGTKVDIISDSVLVGENSFEVADAAPFAIGDNIIIYHPCTEQWLTAVDSGGTYWYLPSAEPGVDLPWEVGSQPLVFNRYITDNQGNMITIDVPFFNHLIRSLSQSYIYKYGRQGIKTQMGVENLRIDIVTAGGVDENHAWNAIGLYQIEDAWVKDCTMLHFGLSGICTNTATRITIENCWALDPVCEITGGNRYNFQLYTASQQILIRNCHASNGRHHYMSNGTSWTSGCVFLDCTSEGAYASSEGHRRWSMALLYDNLVELDGPRPGYNPRLLGLYNRGHYGTSHGWAAAHSVAWNCNVANGDLVVQQPPTAQNYAIGCFGKHVTGTNSPSLFEAPEGYIEGSGEEGLNPRSLYLAQLEERLTTSVQEPHQPKQSASLPEGFALFQNYPNPFNASTKFEFSVQISGHYSLAIIDIRGRLIENIFDGFLKTGIFSTIWNAGNQTSGIYFIRMTDGKRSQTWKLILVK